jgi:4a-hydroxytetrahydrobiopterin dehydratase
MPSRSLLSAADLATRLAALSGWTTDGKHIGKQFAFADFRAAFSWMTACALVAEKLDHHPDWTNVYNRVDVTLWTHDAGGVTEFDLALAEAMDRAAARG